MDVKKNEWYTPYVCFAYENGIFNEYGKFFKPSENISWFKALVLLFNAKNNQSTNRFTSDDLKNYFQTVTMPTSLFHDMTRIEALRVFLEIFGSSIEDPVEGLMEDPTRLPTLAGKPDGQVEESAEDPIDEDMEEENVCDEEDEECKQPEANKYRIINYHIPGTGGGGGGGYVPSVTAVCGNGILEIGEECDGGTDCTDQCTIIDKVPAMIPSDCHTPQDPINGAVNQTRIWPISGGLTSDTMSSSFGPRLQASAGFTYDFHRGVDIPVPTGTPVLAVADGTVTTVYLESNPSSPYPNGGTVIGIEHTDQGTYYSLYMHLDSVDVAVDDAVTKGDQIGLSGMTGTTDFEHLHFEIRDGQIDSGSEPHRNPFNYLPFNNTTNHTLEIVSPELIDSANPTIQTHITAPRDELDINKVKVSVYDSQCQLLEEKEVDFNNRTTSGSDNPIENNVELSPAEFNASNLDYQLDVIFSALTGSDTLLIVTEASDVTGNTVYAEAVVE